MPAPVLDGDAGIAVRFPCTFGLILGEADGRAARAEDCAGGSIDEQTYFDLATAFAALLD